MLHLPSTSLGQQEGRDLHLSFVLFRIIHWPRVKNGSYEVMEPMTTTQQSRPFPASDSEFPLCSSCRGREAEKHKYLFLSHPIYLSNPSTRLNSKSNPKYTYQITFPKQITYPPTCSLTHPPSKMKATTIIFSILALAATGIATPLAEGAAPLSARDCNKVGQRCDGSPERACACDPENIVCLTLFLWAVWCCCCFENLLPLSRFVGPCPCPAFSLSLVAFLTIPSPIFHLDPASHLSLLHKEAATRSEQ